MSQLEALYLLVDANHERLPHTRRVLWGTQTGSHPVILSNAPVTARAAAVLDEAAPGLAGYLARQGITGELTGREHAVACIVREFVEETGRDATEGTASRRWNRWNVELEPRYPVVEACGRALEGTLSLGATFVVRYGMVDCSGLHPSAFFRSLHWNVHAYRPGRRGRASGGGGGGGGGERAHPVRRRSLGVSGIAKMRSSARGATRRSFRLGTSRNPSRD